ncbi:MAG: hypothetical protein HY561_03735 [Gemmatimonadetes bacterium]|nr:hypothetical protein [Gemmatimonadota bacterium]
MDQKTGVADLVMDPRNPNKLFAALWEYRRWPWFFQSGGPGSGLYVTYDAGASWTKLTSQDGLPEGELGRIGVAIAKSNPSVVYALVEAKKSALIRSDDGGKSWRMVNDTPNIASRPFYYADIRVDPTNENRLYSLASRLNMSEDAGKTFREIARGIHSDHHALWIHPAHGDLMVDGNDGGIAISRDHGRTWRFVENLPLAQFYHVSVDMELPYNLYGGMQDNGSWRGPSNVWENGGVRNWHWAEVNFGDGFGVLVDPADATFGYAMSQGGNLRRYNLKTGERKDIRPAGPEGVKLRFNWNAGIATDPFDPKVVYYGSQFLHRSPDRGESWELISPDLTTNDPEKQKQAESGGLTRDVTAAENYETIMTIAPSPVERGVIWVGTDDGNVQLTRDGGKTWTNLVARIRGVAPGSWVPHIEASKHDAATAFITFDDHRRGNWTTYVYKTTDYGRTWTSLTTPDVQGFAHVVEQDPVQPNLLFLGTEFGLFVTLDGGKKWLKWTRGVPTVPVTALVVHPRDHDLVIATHGRAAFILDDIRPLRALAAEPQLLASPLHLFEPAPSYQVQIRQTDGFHFPGDAMFRGQTRRYGALLTYTLAEGEARRADAEDEDDAVASGSGAFGGRRGGASGAEADRPRAEVEVLDAQGKVIRKLRGPAWKGVNRVAWDLRREPFRRAERDDDVPSEWRARGPEVLPGTYTMRVKFGGQEVTRTVEVRPDPRYNVPLAVRQQKFDATMRAGRRQETAVEAVERIRTTMKAVETVLEQARGNGAYRELKAAGDELKKKLAGASEQFSAPRSRQGIFRDDETVLGNLQQVLFSLVSSWDAPTAAQTIGLERAERQLEVALTDLNRLFVEDVAAFRKQVEAAGFTIFPDQKPITMEPVTSTKASGDPGRP